MSDLDPFIRSDVDNRSASVIQVESLGKGGIAAVICGMLLCVFVACLAVCFAVISLDRNAQVEKRMTDKIRQVELRVMDHASLAKQEARIALDVAQTAKAKIEAKEK